MRTTLVTLAALALAILAPAASAAAQMQIQVQSFGDPPRTVGTVLYGPSGRAISFDECVENIEVPIQITNIPASAVGSVFSIWRGAVGSANCHMAANRTMPTGGTRICTPVTGAATNITSTSITLRPTVQQLFGITSEAGCMSSSNIDQDFYFLALSSAEDVSTDATNYVMLRMLYDPVAPGAPTELVGTPGDAAIAIDWTNPSAVESLYGANIYVDAAGCDDAGNLLPDTILQAGGDPPAGATVIFSEGQTVSSASPSGEDLGLALGEWAAVAVTLVDRARNESELSAPICVHRVQVTGFFEAYCAEHGYTDITACREAYRCAVGRVGGERGSMLVLSMIALSAALVIARRRRSAR